MRVLFLGNNWVGWQVLSWLRQQREDIVGLVVHPPHKRKYDNEIIECAGVGPEFVFEATDLRKPETLQSIKMLRPDIGVSALFGYILQPDLLNLMLAGCVNIHPALLPYNRGTYPNVWSIVEGTPAGVTLHYVDSTIDTGDIISQREVPIEPIDTGESLCRKLEQACVHLFLETWPLIRSGKAPRVAQQLEVGTFHRTRDVERIDEIDLDRAYKAKELIDVMRARTFPPYPGVYFKHQGQKVYLRLRLMYEEQSEEHGDGENHRD